MMFDPIFMVLFYYHSFVNLNSHSGHHQDINFVNMFTAILFDIDCFTVLHFKFAVVANIVEKMPRPELKI